MSTSDKKYVLETRNRTCPICGKVFYIPYADMWQFKIKRIEKNGRNLISYLCTWTCYKKAAKMKASNWNIRNRESKFYTGDTSKWEN